MIIGNLKIFNIWMVIFKIIIFIFLFCLFGCSQSFDDDTIAVIGNQKISKSSFHKYMPEARFNALTDSLKIEKTKEFLTDILKEKDIEKMRIQNNDEIKKEMKLWSKRTLAGLLFDKNILNKVFPEDSLKKIYQHYKMERNISVIVIPYIKTKTIKVPDKKEAYGIANDIYNRSKIEDFEFLQRSFSKVEGNPNDRLSHWTKLFSGIKAVDRELWKYNVGEVTKPIDDGQSFRIIKINNEKEDTKLPDYRYQKDMLIRQVLELWKKPLQDYFIKYTDSLLNESGFYIDKSSLLNFSNALKNNIVGKDIISGIRKTNFKKNIGRYDNIILNREWFINEFNEEENLFGYQLADPQMAYGFIKGLISSKLNHKSALNMGMQNSPLYLEKYEEELRTRIKNFYDYNIFKKGLEVKEEEMLDYYNRNKTDFSVSPKILTELLWFNEIELAQNHYKKIISDKDYFSDIYRYIKLQKSSKYGAEQKFIIPSSESDPYHSLFSLENGSISKPFKRGNKFYIIKIIEKIESQIRSFNEVKAQILMRLSKMNNKRNEKVARDRLLKKFKVSINEDLILS
ncbi:MAG: hypothetical protein CBC40_07080 [bacterium TMED80]|nr:MAG: hypothetical protein CBC40_07080 [bacterium TMED80]